MPRACPAVLVRSHSLPAHTAAGCHFEKQLTFAFPLHQIRSWARASGISEYVCPCVRVQVRMCDELLGYAPLTFYWMLMVFIAMAAVGEAGIAVCVCVCVCQV